MKKPNEQEILVGGQAVIEGVMMRTPNAYAVAVRRPDGTMAVDKGSVANLARRYRPLRWPIFRGVGTLAQSLALGIRTLNYSASVAMGEEEGRKSQGTTLALIGSMVLAVIFGVGLFILAPLFLTRGVGLFVPALDNWWLFNGVDGLFRVVFFLLYIFLIARMKDIQRVFEYHGAEHKVVFNREAGEELNADNARKFSRFHPRCGTSFLLFVMVVSIVVFSIFKFSQLQWIVLSRIFLIPLIAGLSYELIRFSARHADQKWCRAFIQPGLWLQRLTTREPNDEQLEVAIYALRQALEVEQAAAVPQAA